MTKQTLSNLNTDIKIFFIMLISLFLFGASLIKVIPLTLSFILLGISAGFLIGFIYFYGIRRLEIHKRKRYKKTKYTLLSKKVSGMIKGYYFVCATILFIGWWRMMAEDCSPRAIGIIFTAMGALVTYLFFSAVGRLNIYKKEYSASRKSGEEK